MNRVATPYATANTDRLGGNHLTDPMLPEVRGLCFDRIALGVIENEARHVITTPKHISNNQRLSSCEIDESLSPRLTWSSLPIVYNGIH